MSWVPVLVLPINRDMILGKPGIFSKSDGVIIIILTSKDV
jgi:hypothetical protein